MTMRIMLGMWALLRVFARYRTMNHVTRMLTHYSAHWEASRRNAVIALLSGDRFYVRGRHPCWAYYHCYHVSSNHDWWMRTAHYHCVTRTVFVKRWIHFATALAKS